MSPLVLGLGEWDCEVIEDGFLAQPVNAISSLGFAVVGIWLIVRGWRRPIGHRLPTVVFGVAVGLVGAGSVMFHGLQSAGSRWLHDWPIAAVVLFVLTYDVAVARSWPGSRLMPVYLGSATGLGVVLAFAPDSSVPIVGLLAMLAVVAEIYLKRRVSLPSLSGANRLAYAVAAVAFVLATALLLLGRKDAPLCRPDSILQGHAAWHLLMAIAAGAFGIRFLERERVAEAKRPQVEVRAPGSERS